MARASCRLRGCMPVSRSGAEGSCMEWMSSSQSAWATKGRRAAARRRSMVSPASMRSSSHWRLRSSSVKREASWLSGSNRSKASMLQNASVSFPRAGRSPASSRPLRAQAPHSSLPCTRALIITWRPPRPESKCQTPSVPVLPARQALMSGAGSSKTRGCGDVVTAVMPIIPRSWRTRRFSCTWPPRPPSTGPGSHSWPPRWSRWPPSSYGSRAIAASR